MTDIEVGAVVRVRDLPWEVVMVQPCTNPPEGWPASAVERAVTAVLRPLGPGAAERYVRVTLVAKHRRADEDGYVIVRPHTEGHYPVCGVCGDAWPCRHEADRAKAVRDTDRLVARLEREAANPHVCPWCERFDVAGRVSRFPTVRSLSGHVARCKQNPARWDLDRWMPWFDEFLRIRGGHDPRSLGPDPEARRVAEAVRQAAIDGVLPDTLAQLLADL